MFTNSKGWIMNRENLIELLEDYRPLDIDESRYKKRILEFINKNEIIFGKENKTGHITASAWIVNRARSRVLLTHHFKLDRWMQLGGHTEEGEFVLQGAAREAQEESGLNNIKSLSEKIFDIDVHSIPEYEGVPEHIHYDIRFAFEADSDETPKISSESEDVKWILVEEIGNYTHERSVLRMVEKTN
jgi:8-oxo-dGTP pyrophosphatase MutT (NUDIX family)